MTDPRYLADHLASLGDDAVPCPSCLGHGGGWYGRDGDERWHDCATCHGTGEVCPAHAVALERAAAAAAALVWDDATLGDEQMEMPF